MLALSFWAATTTLAHAHALPGTILVFAQTEDTLTVEITVNVEDLTIAEPALLVLRDLPVGPLRDELLTDQINTYFDYHMKVTAGSETISFTLDHAEITLGENDHVGVFEQMVLTFISDTAPSTEALTLRYDAVMHEVRNHRAVVYWADPGGGTNFIAEFGYRRIDGAAAPVELAAP